MCAFVLVYAYYIVALYIFSYNRPNQFFGRVIKWFCQGGKLCMLLFSINDLKFSRRINIYGRERTRKIKETQKKIEMLCVLLDTPNLYYKLVQKLGSLIDDSCKTRVLNMMIDRGKEHKFRKTRLWIIWLSKGNKAKNCFSSFFVCHGYCSPKDHEAGATHSASCKVDTPH